MSCFSARTDSRGEVSRLLLGVPAMGPWAQEFWTAAFVWEASGSSATLGVMLTQD